VYRRTQRSIHGFSVTEMLVALALGGLIMLVAVPGLWNILHRSRLDAAVRHVVADLHDARSRAITTGWEYRIVGFDTGSVTNRNQYRLLGRATGSVSWPADTSAPLISSTQYAGSWVSLESMYRGVNLDYTAPRFEITFDSRGTAGAAAATFNPLRVVGRDGDQAQIRVSVVGGITVQ
jgi:prepilin-type N-terminal cleavage/methylation domain-containing protein